MKRNKYGNDFWKNMLFQFCSVNGKQQAYDSQTLCNLLLSALTDCKHEIENENQVKVERVGVEGGNTFDFPSRALSAHRVSFLLEANAVHKDPQT